ncbi:ABC transporter substrate-binding protein [Saccharopolyspora sp. K220]|uniref:ABC transporter substrate-binding protein n=1 Tax=Saccharopolyspora soli TaxID=2926618 RepID=UPI001F5928F4|nr:ABC transporter substrate-binding protein [Saccharopolyspora soli]MCI2422623.1 ABC transporter substrate-binding protein [Saccharopolyspora soli]
MKQEIVVAVPALTPTFGGQDGGNALSLEAFEINANTQAGLVRNPYIPGKSPAAVMQDFNNYQGYLAESYEVGPDGKTVTFRLRQNLLSQSGNPLTADDVLWSFERKFASPTGSASIYAPALTDPKTQIRKIDEHTVAFTINQPGYMFTFLGLLANLNGHIYDMEFLKQHAAPDDPYAIAWSRTNSGWGFGPYSITSVTPGQEMVLTANPHYAFGEPSVKKVTLRVVPDAGTRASLVMRGDVDLAEGIKPVDQVQLSNAPGVVVPQQDDAIEFIDLTLVTNKVPFNNEKVRQAMALAIPYDQIIQQIYAGRATRMVGSINPKTKGYTTNGLPTFNYDPAKAKQLLAEAGFPNGISFDLTVSNAVPDLVDVAVMMRSFAADAGFDINISQQSAAAFAQGRSQASYQALMYRNRSQTQSPTYALTIFWKPNNDSSNPSRWENQQFYSTVDAGIAVPDSLSEEAGRFWNQAMAIELNSAPEIFVANLQPSQVYRNTVQGYTYRSENAVDFANLKVSAGS